MKSKLRIANLKSRIKRILVSMYFLPFTKRLSSEFKSTFLIIPESHYYLDESIGNSVQNVYFKYLKESGWIETKLNNSSFFHGEYFPWITFSAIDFLEQLKISELQVVEFGAGASTLYFAKHSRKVVSFEFDPDYYLTISEISKECENVEIVNCNLSARNGIVLKVLETDCQKDEVLNACLSVDVGSLGFDANKLFESEMFEQLSNTIQNSEFVFVDGGPRNTVLFLVSKLGREDTIVLVDNSDQHYMLPGIKALIESGYIELPFAGLGPLNPYKSQTSIFVKNLHAISRRD